MIQNFIHIVQEQRYRWACIVCVLLLGMVSVEGEEPKKPRPLVLITNVNNSVKEISKRELERLYLKKKRYWVNGERCVPIDQPGTSLSRRDFYRIVLNKDPYEMNRYWMQETMTGNATPPITLNHSAMVKRYVRKIKGGVGYIYADEVDETVKVLHIKDLPEFNSLEKEASDNDEPSEDESKEDVTQEDDTPKDEPPAP